MACKRSGVQIPLAPRESPSHEGLLSLAMAGTAWQTKLVGRADELVQLEEEWRRAASGQFRCVLVAGDPGVGKSELVRTLTLLIAAGEAASQAPARVANTLRNLYGATAVFVAGIVALAISLAHF